MEKEQQYFAVKGITNSDRVLHTPSSFAKKNLTYVQEVGILKSLKPHWCIRNNVESYLFLYVKSGAGILKADNGLEYTIKTGDCVFVDCRQEYAHCSSEEEPWELAWVHFNGEEVKAYYDFFRQANTVPYFHMKKGDQIMELIDELMTLQKQKDIYGEFKSAASLKQLLTMLILEMKFKEQKTSQEFFERIRAYISENYTHDNLLKEIDEQFQTGEFDVQVEFKKRYGLELWDYILNRKFTVAKELLRFSVKPVQDIVDISGIRNTDLFYQLFKENEGMSPEEYRKKWAQWIK